VSPHHLISPAVECNLLLLSSITPSPYCFHFRYNVAELLKGNVPTREVKGSNPENVNLVELWLSKSPDYFSLPFRIHRTFSLFPFCPYVPITLCTLERKRFKLKG